MRRDCAEGVLVVMRAVAVGDEGTSQEAPQMEYAQWASSIYQLERRGAMKAGFAVGSVELSAGYRLLVIDVARSAVRRLPQQHRSETWGYGYRLLVEIADIKGLASLTLPAIAASVELGQVQASVQLQVKGYNGSELWGELPVPRPLDVDTYKEYVAAAGRIQEAFATHPDKACPVLLAESDDSVITDGGVNEIEVREAVALVGLLRHASEEHLQEKAAAEFGARSDLPEDVIDQLANGLYRGLEIGADEGSRQRGAERASALLNPLDR